MAAPAPSESTFYPIVHEDRFNEHCIREKDVWEKALLSPRSVRKLGAIVRRAMNQRAAVRLRAQDARVREARAQPSVLRRDRLDHPGGGRPEGRHEAPAHVRYVPSDVGHPRLSDRRVSFVALLRHQQMMCRRNINLPGTWRAEGLL